MKRFKFLLYFCSLFIFCSTGKAITLGEIETKSYLNEPLMAEIPIERLDSSRLANIKIQLASPEAYHRLGFALPQHLPALTFKIIPVHNQAFIQVISTQAINLPILEFLLEISYQGQEAYRYYTILLDPALPNSKHFNPLPASVFPPTSLNKKTSATSVAKETKIQANPANLPNLTDIKNKLQTTYFNNKLLENSLPNSQSNANATPNFVNNEELLKIQEKFSLAQAQLISVQQKNEWLSLRLQDLQSQMSVLQKQLADREQRLVIVETQLRQYKNLHSQVHSLQQKMTHTNKNQMSFSTSIFLIACLAGLFGLIIYLISLKFDWIKLKKLMTLKKDSSSTSDSVPQSQEELKPEHNVDFENKYSSDLISTPQYPEQEQEKPIAEIDKSETLTNTTSNLSNDHLPPSELNNYVNTDIENNENDRTINFHSVKDEFYPDELSEHHNQKNTLTNKPYLTLSTNESEKTKTKEEILINEKIDLAIAYIEFKDTENAKVLLELVLKQGNEEQILRAKQILDSLHTKP